jgi:hypothetical protein
MLDWLKGKTASGGVHPLRETLFGDVPLAAWAGTSATEPWRSFARVSALTPQDRDAAIRGLEEILAYRGLESRHYLEAWAGLTSFGVRPPEGDAKHLYGVVVDMPVRGGLDTLAAYEDLSARCLNFSGAAVIWEHPDSSLDDPIRALMSAGGELLAQIGRWEGPRPPLPQGQARISLLTPSGLHFGQADPSLLSRDAMAAPVLRAATTLMQALIAPTQRPDPRMQPTGRDEHRSVRAAPPVSGD